MDTPILPIETHTTMDITKDLAGQDRITNIMGKEGVIIDMEGAIKAEMTVWLALLGCAAAGAFWSSAAIE